MKKPLLFVFINLIVCTGFVHVAAQSLSTSPTLTFSNNTGFGDNIATDGEGGSVTISDINIQALPINSSGVKLTGDVLEFHSSDWPVPPIITYGGSTSFFGWSIRSDNGADFSLVSFDFNDWGEWSGDNFIVQAFHNGSSVGSVSFTGNIDNSMVHVTNPGALTSIFQTVDEVRIYRQGGIVSWTGINNIKVSSPATALPVTLLSFTATRKENGVLLNWNTSAEENTKTFEVQHDDGSHWNTVATIDAAGHSGQVRNYTYLHKIIEGGTQYYRILERDMDGKESYSKVVVVNFGMVQDRLNVYPNPLTNGKLNLVLDQEETIQLFDASGCLLLQKQLQPGIQKLQLPLLKKGFYFIKAAGKTEKLLVQ